MCGRNNPQIQDNDTSIEKPCYDKVVALLKRYKSYTEDNLGKVVIGMI